MVEKAAKKPIRWDSVKREAGDLVWKHRKRLALGLALMLVSRLSGLVLPASSKVIVDHIIQKPGNARLLMPLALVVLAASIVQAITSFALSQVLGVAGQQAIMDMRKRVQAHVLRLPVRYFDSTQTGVLISRVMSDAEGIRNLVGTGLVQLAGSLITAIIAVGVLFYLNWQLTAINLAILCVFGGGLAFTFTRLRPVFRQRGKINAEVTGRLTESLGGIRIVKAYTAERREDLVFAKGIHRLFRNVAKAVTGVSAVTAASTAITGILGSIMIVVGGRAILAHPPTMTAGDLVMYVAFTSLLASPMIQLSSIGTQISEAFAGLDRIHEINSMTTEDDEDLSRKPLAELRGDIEFQDVSFEYNPGVRVLKNISFMSPAGTTTALVGSSGSGKSTLISLVLAFNHPVEGKVLVDGQDIGELRLRDYRTTLGVVLQDNFLFDGTIADNIRFARPHASLDDVKRVSRIAHCDEFIEEFEKSYDTIVGERGVRLSGGQRQRVAIARAILADPRILILDEATSSLDSESEAMIQDGLASLRRGRTTFVIAHRLSTIRSATQILVLEHSEIVERGTHDELLAMNGRYKQLYDRQYQLELNRFINPGEDFTPEPAKVVVPRPAGAAARL